MIDSFQWILPGKLAGAGRPGWMTDLDADLQWLQRRGIRLVVSLTQKPLPATSVEGLAFHHFPIRDMGIPDPRSTYHLCQMILEHLDRDEGVLLHCKAGLGRTGTILACCLVSQGLTPEEAISRVRNVSTYYIQTQTQEMFITHYQEFLEQLEDERAADASSTVA